MPRRKSSSRPIPVLPAIVSDSQVLRVREWAALANVSMRTARRLLAAGDGPKIVKLSSRRVGVTIAAHKEWIASREATP